jgi:ureidoacrylate peracid hydrolase
MHQVAIRPEIIERVLARRGQLHLYEALDRRGTALVVIDMQNAFVAPGAPIEVPGARAIVPTINRLAAELRRRGVPVIWVLHQNEPGGRDWERFFGVFVRPEKRAAAAQALCAGNRLQELWPELNVEAQDVRLTKNRYSALIAGASRLPEILRERKIDTLLIAGTKTNVCCESTARDAMQRNYKIVFVADGNAAVTDAEHNATLGNMIALFADVMTTGEIVALIEAGARRGVA